MESIQEIGTTKGIKAIKKWLDDFRAGKANQDLAIDTQ